MLPIHFKVFEMWGENIMNLRSWNFARREQQHVKYENTFNGKNYSIRQFKISATYSVKLLCYTK
jgi:hypothetical protein